MRFCDRGDYGRIRIGIDPGKSRSGIASLKWGPNPLLRASRRDNGIPHQGKGTGQYLNAFAFKVQLQDRRYLRFSPGQYAACRDSYRTVEKDLYMSSINNNPAF